MSTLCGFSLIANVLLQQLLGIQLPVVFLFALGSVVAFYIAFRDIQLSAKAMLYFEGAAILVVAILGVLIWKSTGRLVGTAQLKLEGVTPGMALSGVVLVVFGFSGFESSTALGDEAKEPLKTIPRSIIQSVVLAGIFFLIMAYIVVLGFSSTGKALGESEAPLDVLAHAIGWGRLSTLLNFGILLSFFSCTLASINSTARILFAMARHGLVADSLGQAHLQNSTPHVAVGLTALLTFSAPTVLYLSGVSAFDGQGYFGTLCSFGFIVVYILISIAAPYYLRAIKQLTPRAIAYSVGGVAFMALPLIGTIGIPGSKLLPTLDRSGLIQVAVFILYMLTGFGWLLWQRSRRPKMIDDMQSAIRNVHVRFEQVREHTLVSLSTTPPSSSPHK